MQIRVTAEGFELPADSLVKLSKESVDGKKSQYDRRHSALVEEGDWHRTKRPLYFKPGEEFEYDGPITNRLVQSQVEVLKAEPAEVEVMKTGKRAEKPVVKKKRGRKKKV